MSEWAEARTTDHVLGRWTPRRYGRSESMPSKLAYPLALVVVEYYGRHIAYFIGQSKVREHLS